jgi:hypothetical protein
MSNAQVTAPAGRKRSMRESATTAVGLAAERLALVNRAQDRERRVSDARTAARRLDQHAADAKP